MVRPKNRYERRRRNAIAKALRSPALAPKVIPKKTPSDEDWNYDDYLREGDLDEFDNDEAYDDTEVYYGTQDDFRDAGLRGFDDVSAEPVDD